MPSQLSCTNLRRAEVKEYGVGGQGEGSWAACEPSDGPQHEGWHDPLTGLYCLPLTSLLNPLCNQLFDFHTTNVRE